MNLSSVHVHASRFSTLHISVVTYVPYRVYRCFVLHQCLLFVHSILINLTNNMTKKCEYEEASIYEVSFQTRKWAEIKFCTTSSFGTRPVSLKCYQFSVELKCAHLKEVDYFHTLLNLFFHKGSFTSSSMTHPKQ